METRRKQEQSCKGAHFWCCLLREYRAVPHPESSGETGAFKAAPTPGSVLGRNTDTAERHVFCFWSWSLCRRCSVSFAAVMSTVGLLIGLAHKHHSLGV